MNTTNRTAATSLAHLRAYERGQASDSYAKFQVVLFILIIVMLLITLGVGVSVYRSISEQRWADEQNRTGLTLLANSVHITDSVDAIGVGAAPQGQALVLTERFPEGSYETRIYLHDGNIVEEYAIAGAPYDPARATPVVDSNTFSFAYAGGLLSIHTDQGTQEVMLHSVRRTSSQTVHSEGGEGGA